MLSTRGRLEPVLDGVVQNDACEGEAGQSDGHPEQPLHSVVDPV